MSSDSNIVVKQMIEYMAKQRGISNEEMTEMLTKCEAEIAWLTAQIGSIRNYEETIRQRKAELKSGIEMMDEIIAERKISDAHLRMLVEKIIIRERDNRLQVEICLKADFRQHIDFYDENGNLSEKAFEMIAKPNITSEGFLQSLLVEGL